MQVGPPQPADEPSPPPGGPPPWSPGPAADRPGGGPWPVVAAVLVGCWAVAVTVGAQAVGWLVEQVLLVAGLTQPAWVWPVTGIVNTVLVGVPAVLLAVLPRAVPVRAAGRVWLVGALALGAFGLLRAIPPAQNEAYLAALAGTAAVATALVRWRAGRPRATSGAWSAGTGFAIAAGLALLLPWVWFGALGGLLETALALAASATIGWFVANLLDGRFWAGYEHTADGSPAGPARLVLLGGLVVGVALALVAGGTGQAGTQLATLLVLPATGFTLAALRRLTRPDADPPADPAPVGWLVGLAVLGPLAFVDPEEISILLASSRDIPFWAAVATGGSLAVALLLGTAYGVAFGRTRGWIPRRWVGAVTSAVVLLGAGAVYLGPGQPGFHGEKLFVVLKEQASLGDLRAGPTGVAGQPGRVGEVYRRLVDTASRTQVDLRRQLDRWRLDYTPYYLVNAIEVDGGPAVRAWLSRRDDVDGVLLSQQLRPLPEPPGTSHGGATGPSVPPWNLTGIGADRVWSQLGATGSGIVVGSSDSGVDGRHPALAAGFRGGDDSWFDPWNGTRSPTDQGGHGTHTLATAVGTENVGVAPGARWIGCVNLDRNLGNPAHYLDCLQFMLAPFPNGGDPFADGRPDRAPQVLTNSWGCPPIEGCDAGALRPATAAFAAAGIFFTAAAGNTGPVCGSIDDPPAPYADVFTVGAVDRDRQVAPFSSRGPAAGDAAKPDLVAPGADVLSAMPGGGYATLSGTSMATPHVAGVVALMWSANPALVGDLDRTWRILRQTATPVPSPDGGSTVSEPTCGLPSNLTGAGLVDAYAAVRAAQQG
ncbi:S8 family serine peptidase [Micromonospora sp. NBC_01796]|uniref:S8 family serine peptidase n=1 Tax=Micromonospora sp. NBC_01796 TaxID=2975987 RepID=UPI002DD99D38|nr:S8 family serine peptidase [Micromonospora sp. NBC_01796]WSA89004.1 S8 family serine peptidase [Micromonospora sp. NBC_01796]